MNEVEQAHADRDFWYEVRDIIDPNMKLHGFSYRNSAAFHDPNIEINGRVARVLITQRDTIRQLQKSFACFLEAKI